MRRRIDQSENINTYGVQINNNDRGHIVGKSRKFYFHQESLISTMRNMTCNFVYKTDLLFTYAMKAPH